MTKEMKETVRHYLLLRGVSTFGMAIFSAVYVTFLMAKGLNLLQVNLVNFVFFTTLFIFEIPTGAFADIFGRKLSFVLSCGLWSLSMLVYGMSHSFWGFALAEAIGAVGSTFASGAFQAWLIDRLKHQGFTGSFQKIFAREQQVKGVVAIGSAIIGAFLAGWKIESPWFFGFAVMGTAGCLAFFYMREEDEFVHKKFSFTDGIKAMTKIVTVSARYGASNTAVRFILIVSVIQFFAVQAPNMQWQPFFGQFLPDKTSFGFVYASMSAAMIIGSILAPRFLKTVKDEKMAISLSQMVIGTGICLTTMFHRLAPALGIFLVHEVARGLFVPLKDAYLNDNIPSDKRATLISFDSISHHVGGMIGLLASGAMAQYLSIPVAWMVSGLVLIGSTLALLKNGHKT